MELKQSLSRNWFRVGVLSTGVQMNHRGPCTIYGGPQIKYDQSGVLSNIMVACKENKFKMLFITKNKFLL